jgi:ABC-2 type transport system permease protein
MEYKAQIVVKICADAFFVAMTLIFWGAVFALANNINGWTFAQMMLLQGFFNTFTVLLWLLFAGAQNLNREILEGKLDKYLTRPISPIIAHMFANIEFFIFDDLFRAVAFFAIAFASGAQFAALNMLASFAFVIIAALALAFILLTIECTAFWLGRIDASHQITGLLWDIGQYPTTILPGGIQFIFVFVLPVFFLQTYPALFTTQAIGWESFLTYSAIALGSLIFWFLVFSIVWKRGLKRYEAYGG